MLKWIGIIVSAMASTLAVVDFMRDQDEIITVSTQHFYMMLVVPVAIMIALLIVSYFSLRESYRQLQTIKKLNVLRSMLVSLLISCFCVMVSAWWFHFNLLIPTVVSCAIQAFLHGWFAQRKRKIGRVQDQPSATEPL